MPRVGSLAIALLDVTADVEAAGKQRIETAKASPAKRMERSPDAPPSTQPTTRLMATQAGPRRIATRITKAVMGV